MSPFSPNRSLQLVSQSRGCSTDSFLVGYNLLKEANTVVCAVVVPFPFPPPLSPSPFPLPFPPPLAMLASPDIRPWSTSTTTPQASSWQAFAQSMNPLRVIRKPLRLRFNYVRYLVWWCPSCLLNSVIEPLHLDAPTSHFRAQSLEKRGGNIFAYGKM